MRQLALAPTKSATGYTPACYIDEFHKLSNNTPWTRQTVLYKLPQTRNKTDKPLDVEITWLPIIHINAAINCHNLHYMQMYAHSK